MYCIKLLDAIGQQKKKEYQQEIRKITEDPPTFTGKREETEL